MVWTCSGWGVSFCKQASWGSLICWQMATCTRSGCAAFPRTECIVALHSGSLQQRQRVDELGHSDTLSRAK